MIFNQAFMNATVRQMIIKGPQQAALIGNYRVYWMFTELGITRNIHIYTVELLYIVATLGGKWPLDKGGL